MTQREQQILRWIEENPMISQAELAQRLGITRSSVAVHISNLMKKGLIAGKGYVLKTGAYAAVVGAVNMDIGGRSQKPLLAADSNPGQVRMSLGGVGRNIAHNLSLLGADVRMLTAYGDDLYGRKIASSCAELGIDLSHALEISGAATSTYLYIAEPEGEMALAVSDMEICQCITPAYLSRNLPLLNRARAVVCDTNLPAESLSFLCEQVSAPLFCDPVSATKAKKLLPMLGQLHTLKPNRLEAEALTGRSIRSRAEAEQAAALLLDAGLQQVFLTLGPQGCYGATPSRGLWMPPLPARMVSTTGCGDAFSAALVFAYLEGADLQETLEIAQCAAAIAMESHETINPAMCAALLDARLAEFHQRP